MQVLVDGCVFERNFALSYGGGIYFAWDLASGHRSLVNSTTFIENESPGGAGGLEIGFARGGSASNGNQVFAYNLRFIRNKATYGGGVYVFLAGKLAMYVILLWIHITYVIEVPDHVFQQAELRMVLLVTMSVLKSVCLRRTQLWSMGVL